MTNETVNDPRNVVMNTLTPREKSVVYILACIDSTLDDGSPRPIEMVMSSLLGLGVTETELIVAVEAVAIMQRQTAEKLEREKAP